MGKCNEKQTLHAKDFFNHPTLDFSHSSSNQVLVDSSVNGKVDVGEPDHVDSSRLDARNEGAGSRRVQPRTVDGNGGDESFRPGSAYTVGSAIVLLGVSKREKK